MKWKYPNILRDLHNKFMLMHMKEAQKLGWNVFPIMAPIAMCVVLILQKCIAQS